ACTRARVRRAPPPRRATTPRARAPRAPPRSRPRRRTVSVPASIRPARARPRRSRSWPSARPSLRSIREIGWSAVAPPVLDPQIQAVLDEQAAAGVKAPGDVTPDELRAQFVKLSTEQWGDVVDELHAVEDADADGVPIRIYRPVETDEPSMAL